MSLEATLHGLATRFSHKDLVIRELAQGITLVPANTIRQTNKSDGYHIRSHIGLFGRIIKYVTSFCALGTNGYSLADAHRFATLNSTPGQILISDEYIDEPERMSELMAHELYHRESDKLPTERIMELVEGHSKLWKHGLKDIIEQSNYLVPPIWDPPEFYAYLAGCPEKLPSTESMDATIARLSLPFPIHLKAADVEELRAKSAEINLKIAACIESARAKLAEVAPTAYQIHLEVLERVKPQAEELARKVFGK